MIYYFIEWKEVLSMENIDNYSPNNIMLLMNTIEYGWIDKKNNKHLKIDELNSSYINSNLIIYEYQKPLSHIGTTDFYSHCENGIRIS